MTQTEQTITYRDHRGIVRTVRVRHTLADAVRLACVLMGRREQK